VVHDGKIARWTDYWITGLPIKMMTGEDVSGLASTQPGTLVTGSVCSEGIANGPLHQQERVCTC
jgi:hypothetical protein